MPVVAESKHTTVTFDGSTIAIDRRGLGRKGRDVYALAQLSGVTLVPPSFGSVGGRFTLVLAGSVQRGHLASQRVKVAADDPLTVVFSKSRLPAFQALTDAITAALAARAAQGAAPAAQQSAVDLAGQLQQLAALRAQGVLSDAEFAAAKDRLIGGGTPQDQPPRW